MQEETVVKETNTGDAAAAVVAEETESVRRIRMTFERQLSHQGLYITLSLGDPTLKQYAADYGFPQEKIEGFKILYNDVEKLYSNQKLKAAELLEAIRLFLEKLDTARIKTQEIVNIARLAFKKDPAAYVALELNRIRKRTNDAWILQHKYFYETILAQTAYVAQITKYNVLQAQLDDGYNALLETIDAASKKLNAKAEAQKATELKTKAWLKLKWAMRKYHNVMKAVLEEDPQMKEKLGMVTPIEV